VKARYTLRRGGFPPALTDEEVITLEICGAYFKLQSDKDLFDYFHSHYRHFFPYLKDRSSFVRQAADLWQVKAAIWRVLVRQSGQQHAPVQVIDTLPLPVCTYTRSIRDRCFKTLADYGHCAAKKLDYYGFKLGLRVSPIGMITHFPLLNARAHDVNHTFALVEGFAGLCPADKGFIDPFRQPLLFERYGVRIVTPVRKNMTEEHPRALGKFCSRIRKIVETVGSHLTETVWSLPKKSHTLGEEYIDTLDHCLCEAVSDLNKDIGHTPGDLLYSGLFPTEKDWSDIGFISAGTGLVTGTSVVVQSGLAAGIAAAPPAAAGAFALAIAGFPIHHALWNANIRGAWNMGVHGAYQDRTRTCFERYGQRKRYGDF